MGLCQSCRGQGAPAESIGGADAPLLTEKRRLTPQQAEANAQAAAHIGAVAAAMAEVPEAERSSDIPWWGRFQGAIVEEALEHTPLVDLEYVVMLAKLGGVMPCGLQNVPAAALVTKDNLWRLKLWNQNRLKSALGVLVFSYPWLDWFHPDRFGMQLRRLLPFLEAMLVEAKSDSPHCTVGVMIDFLCLPQKPFRAEVEKEQFKRSLVSINEWYYHKSTYVLLVTAPPPEGDEYGNTRLHKNRGWCFFEKAAAMVVKKAWCLLDFSSYQGSDTFGDSNPSPGTCLGQMRAGRAPPLSPMVFGEKVRTDVASGALAFTAQADQDFVIKQYEKGLRTAVNRVANNENPSFRTLSFQNLRWGDQQATELLEFMRYVTEHCTFPHGPIEVACIKGNHFSKDIQAELHDLKDHFIFDRTN